MQVGHTWTDLDTGTTYRVVEVEVIETEDGSPVIVSRGEPVGDNEPTQ